MASFVNSVRQAAVATKDAYEKFERGRQWVQQKQQLVEHKAQVTAPGEDQFDQIVDAAHTAIVKIIALDSRASGFFVSEDGYVLSSHEVGTWVAKGDALAQTHDGDIGKLTRIADYPDLDYALLKLDIRPLRSSWLRPDFLGVYPGKSVVLAGFNHQAGHYEPAFTSAHVSSSDDISCSLCSVVVDPGVYGGPVLGSPVGHYCGIIHGASRQDKAPEGQIAFTPLVSTTYPVDADIMKHRQLNPAERTFHVIQYCCVVQYQQRIRSSSTMRLRAWSWTRIDGRNVLALPTRDEIHLYDSDDFHLLDAIAPSGHDSAVAFVRWSAFHGRLASLSESRLIVHAPQRVSSYNDNDAMSVRFEPLCCLQVQDHAILQSIKGLAFSRCANFLMVCGPAGIGIIDVRAQQLMIKPAEATSVNDLLLCIAWQALDEPASDVAKFSPCSLVFGSLQVGKTALKVWRMKRGSTIGTIPAVRTLGCTESLVHNDPIVYFSWKPATTQLHTAGAFDGLSKARWFEPKRILLTCAANRVVQFWTESDIENGACFVKTLRFEPSDPISNFRWVLSKNRNISEEKFDLPEESEATQTDWISGVDHDGVLRLWQVTGILSSTAATIEETSVRIKVNGYDNAEATFPTKHVVPLEEISVMAYFSQNYFGLPSKMDIVLQRADSIVLSYHVSLGKKSHETRIRKKNWYRSHAGSICSMAAHPSLPLLASVDAKNTEDGATSYEILISWLSSAAFSVESRLVPSGVLSCDQDNGDVLCVQWVPTLHFDAIPLLLVAYTSGVIDVYGRTMNAVGVVTSPKMRVHSPPSSYVRSPSMSPWTYFDYTTGASGVEYEISLHKHPALGIGLSLAKKANKLFVSHVDNEIHTSGPNHKVCLGDELLAINNKNVLGKEPADISDLVQEFPVNELVVLRLRGNSNQPRGMHKMPELSLNGSVPLSSRTSQATSPPSSVSSTSNNPDEIEHSIEHYSSELRSSFMSSIHSDVDSHEKVVHAGSISTYGGWSPLQSFQVAKKLSLVCVCPVYADDGEYVPDTVVIFGVLSHPGSLCAWKGVHTMPDHSFEVSMLEIKDSALSRKSNITSIAGERDYRQRAFSSKRQLSHEALNSLIFIGDSRGSVEHWRCHIDGDSIQFTMMSTCHVSDSPVDNPNGRLPLATPFNSRQFFRRGYMVQNTSNINGIGTHEVMKKANGVYHIEVDDPNRIAVIDASRCDKLYIFEGESGLGMLRLEATISSEGRGNILAFCWCNAHVEFNVDALAVNYSSGIVIYQYDMNYHCWTQIGDDIPTTLAIFDCTRDASALMIGGGHVTDGLQAAQKQMYSSNEMPVIIGKWDEPGKLLQNAMDWKAAESPQKLPVWHPYVILTTLFGMHARVGVKDTYMASDKPSFEFSRAFKDAVQMLKLLANVLEDDTSAELSARNGVLAYTVPKAPSPNTETPAPFLGRIGRRESVGRYSTSVHQNAQLNKAENLFNGSIHSSRAFEETTMEKPPSVQDIMSQNKLSMIEARTIQDCIDCILVKNDRKHGRNAFLLLGSFDREHLLELKAILHYVDAIQSLGFDLDTSAADLGAKRYFSMVLFSKSLKFVLSSYNQGNEEPEHGLDFLKADQKLSETPSSGILWALHSYATQFLIEHVVQQHATWDEMKPMWLGLWIKDAKDLRNIIERLAKSAYMRDKDAMGVCLYYTALGKKNILGALAKLSNDDRNKNLAVFLEHDFSQERWCNAAVKNAYSLLSKKQYEAAAAFFLLCEPPRLQEAMRILSVRLCDPSLALVISRLVEYRMSDAFQHDFISSGSQREITVAGDCTKMLLEQDIIPHFRERRDRYLESCALWWLERFEQACTVLLPTFQPIDITEIGGGANNTRDLDSRTKQAVEFYINVTSLPIYFQYIYSNINAPLVSWAMKKLRRASTDLDSIPISNSKKRRLASTADIEHAFSFSAYVCKQSGLSDTSLVEMLQARHLINLHARFELATLENAEPVVSPTEKNEVVVTSPRYRHSMRNLNVQIPKVKVDTSWMASSNPVSWGASPRRMSDLDDADLQSVSPITGSVKTLSRSKTAIWSQLMISDKAVPSAPWLKAQIADIECRRWSSSAFVGKMLGIRVAREMIGHFRAVLDVCFRHEDVDAAHLKTEPHRAFLEELCTPLCEQFQIDRKYVIESALAVMQPHAHLHIVEICFLLSELGRSGTLCKWIRYVSLSMLHACSTFASCEITDDIYRDWEGLTIQLCYVLNLNAHGQLNIPNYVLAQIAVAVRMGCLFLSWCREESAIVQEAISTPFFSRVSESKGIENQHEFFADLSRYSFEINMNLIRKIQHSTKSTADNQTRNFGYVFMGTVANHQQELALIPNLHSENSVNHKNKLHEMYTLILMVSILRTFHARARSFISGCPKAVAGEDTEVLDVSSSLFTPHKLWKSLDKDPLEGIKRWYALMESHLRCEFDYSVKPVHCICGLYGLGKLKYHEVVSSEDELTEPDQPPENGSAADKTTNAVHRDVSLNYNGINKFLRRIGMTSALHSELLRVSDDYILALMRHPKYGVRPALRRFRMDPRVHVKCFVLRDAAEWFTSNRIFASDVEAHEFLSRCCKQRKLRLLVKHRQDPTNEMPSHGKVLHHSSDSAELDHSQDELSMTFVDPWEVEAERNVHRYMHGFVDVPIHVELGWDRLSPVAEETCDEIIGTVFDDKTLVDMWKMTCAEGWLVTSITQYQLDGVHSHRAATDETTTDNEEKLPFLVEIHSRSQRNAMFKEVGLPHRFVGVVTVNLIEGREFLPCSWLTHSSDPYVFFELTHDGEAYATAETWNIQTYRSRVGPGGVNPRWDTAEDSFAFRFAVPTHREHIRVDKTTIKEESSIEHQEVNNLWSTMTGQSNGGKLSAARSAVESVLSTMFKGPPMVLHCTVFQKNMVLTHQFMGRGKVSLNTLTSGHPMDIWIPLKNVPTGSVHVQLSLSFQLMCSTVAGAEELHELS